MHAADITTHIRRLVPLAGEAVSLTTLRRSLAHYPRDLVDAALYQLADQDDVLLWAEADQKRLTDQDRDAALVLGGTARHLLLITG